VTGSVATIAYGEPRFTNDVDVVVRLPLNAIERVRAAFPDEEFHLSRQALRDAVLRSTQFNILHPRSGLKVDVNYLSVVENGTDDPTYMVVAPQRTIGG